MQVVEYNNANNIWVKFENGNKVQCCATQLYEKTLRNTSRINEIGYNTYNQKMQIIEYTDSNDIIVSFESGCKVKTTYYNFQKGYVKDYESPSVFNVGIVGQGKYAISTNGKHSLYYSHWSHMLERVYDPNYHKKFPTYKECSVSDNFKHFQFFCEWLDAHYYDCGETLFLDKDLKFHNNKHYSEDTCLLLPIKMNGALISRINQRGDFPIGVSYQKNGRYKNKYRASCGNGTKQIYIGHYSTPEKAFEAYKEYKENHLKNLAEEYKHKIPSEVYNALINYKVEITD